MKSEIAGLLSRRHKGAASDLFREAGTAAAKERGKGREAGTAAAKERSEDCDTGTADAKERSKDREAGNRHRIAVISDTHGLLRPEAEELIHTCEAVLHAGDVGSMEVLTRLRGMMPVWAVRGNSDRGEELARELPQELIVTLFGFRIYMVHDKAEIPADLTGADLVICGHSHIYEHQESMAGKETIFVNPGSCGPRRFFLPATMVVLTIDEEKHLAWVQPFVLDEEKRRFVSSTCESDEEEKPDRGTGMPACEPVNPAQGAHMSGMRISARQLVQKTGNLPSDRELDRLIRAVIKQVDAGRTVAEIASRTQADAELVSDICRIYVTHPGVGVDGIMDRMERKNL